MSKLTSKSSKADEIEALNEMATECGKGSYLADLFSPKMITWVTRQIELDGICDLYEAMTAGADREEALLAQLAESKGRISRLEYWNAQKRS